MYNSTEDILIAAIAHLIRQIINRSEAEGQRASGRSYAELAGKNISLTHADLVGPTWIGVWEDGRKPGKVPKDFVEIIMEWATHKGISWANADPVTFEKWANGVKWNIIKHGTKLYRSGQKLDIFETAVKDFEEFLNAELKVFYETEITNAIRTAWQNER